MSLQVWLPLIGDLRNQGLKNYNISVARGSEIYSNNGKIGKCFYANGVNTLKIQNIISDFYNYSSYSISAWFCVEAKNPSHTGSAIISAGNWNQQVINLALGTWNDNGYYTRLHVSGTSWGVTYNYNFLQNKWYHVVVSSNGNKTFAYVNGVLIGDTAAGFLPSSIEGNDIYIGGATYYSGMQFFGKINDVRIYDHCLSQKEIEELAKGLWLHYKFDDVSSTTTITNLLGRKSQTFTIDWSSYGFNGSGIITETTDVPVAINGQVAKITASADNVYGEIATSFTGTSLNKNNSITVSGYVMGDGATIGKTVHIHAYATNGTNTISSGRDYVLTDDWQRISYTLTWTYDNPSNTTFNIYFHCPRDENEYFYLCNCQAEMGNLVSPFTATAVIQSNTIADSSGYLYNATINGNLTTINSGARYDYAIYKYDGISNYIQTPTLYFNNEAITINTWIKSSNTTPGNNYHMIMDSTANRQWYEMCIQNTGILRAGLYINSSRYADNCTTSTALNGEWHMCSITYDGAIVKRYFDGVLESTSSVTISTGLQSPTTLRFFIDGTSSNYCAKEFAISDFRIYATALTEAQILELYNTSITIDKNGNGYARELLEGYNSLSVNRQGQFKATDFNEDTLGIFSNASMVSATKAVQINNIYEY